MNTALLLLTARLRRMGRAGAQALCWLMLGLVTLWALLALWFDGAGNRIVAGVLVALFVVALIALGIWVRPLWRMQAAAAGLPLVVIIWWLLIPASNERNWMPDVARPAHASISGSMLTIHNVRNFDYRSETDFTPHWETRSYDLDQLRGADMFLSYWGPTLIAHTIASWEFADGPPLAISIETRKEVGETYSALRGFFRQYELYYVVADERDVIGVRTNHRGEQVFLYRLRLNPELARAVLLDYIYEINHLAEQPEWYNAVTHNCTTTIRHHALHVGAGKPWDWRILANGRIDQLGYERGTIDSSLPFAELRARSEITERARLAGSAPDFSARIREGLPARPLPTQP